MKTNPFHYVKLTLIAVCAIAATNTSTAKRVRHDNDLSSVRNVNFDAHLDTTRLSNVPGIEADVNELMKNWYLNNYTILDKDADKRSSVATTDEVYIDRLQKMPTIIEMPFNSLVRSYIEMYVKRKKSLVEAMLGLSLYYMPIFEEALDRHGMPLELKYLPIIESALNPNAVSPAGAHGLWQFMESTGRDEGLEINSLVDERLDPYRASEAAAVYLSKLYKIYGDWSLAIAAYNCGPGNVNKAIRRAGGGKKDFWEIYNYLPKETRNYIPAFIAANYVMNYYHEHNISPVLAAKPIVVDTVHVSRRVGFQQISDVLNIPIEELRILNPQYCTDIIPGNIHPYSLALPGLQVGCYIENEDSIVNYNAEKYALRDIVEPGQSSNSNQKGEYVETVVVKYHKVKSGETVASVAKKYGVSRSEVRRANGGKKKLKRNTTLKINVTERKFVESTDSTAVSTNTTVEQQVPTTNDSIEVAQTDSIASQKADKTVEQAISKTKQQQQEKPKTTTHVVKAGETLGKIATKYGVTVNDIKNANNLKKDLINVGQKLKIPAKQTYKSTKKSSKKKSRKNRK